MLYSSLSFWPFRTDKNRILWMSIASWTLSVLFGMFLSFLIVPSVSIDVTSFFDNGPSAALQIVSLAVYVFVPTIVFRFLGIGLFFLFFLLVCKGILTGFLLTTTLFSFGAYAWLINCFLQITDALCTIPILMIWIFGLLRDVNKMRKFVFLALVLCAVIWYINRIYTFPLIETILSCVF